MGYGPITPDGKQLPITPFKGSWAWEQEQRRIAQKPPEPSRWIRRPRPLP